jgi:hypothetical protein
MASSAEAKPREFTPGEVVPQGGGQFIKILQCRIRATTKEPECEVQNWENGRAASQAFWWDAELIVLRQQGQRVDMRRRRGSEDHPASLMKPVLP